MSVQQPKIFGVLVAGRPIQADFLQMSETEFVTEVVDAGTINHVVVFMTGLAPFPDNMGGTVYIRWPKIGGETNWHYLGFIANDKPSAIFRVAQLCKTDAAHAGLFTSMSEPTNGNVVGSAQIGISVEPLPLITGKVPAEGTSASQQSSFMEFAEKMLQNFAHHLQSFAVRLPRPDNSSESTDFIPASAVQNWYTNFTRRLEQNPDFWKNLS